MTDRPILAPGFIWDDETQEAIPRTQMPQAKLREKLTGLLDTARDQGIGSKRVALIAAECLFDFIAKEAGAFFPAALEEVVYRLQELEESAL